MTAGIVWLVGACLALSEVFPEAAAADAPEPADQHLYDSGIIETRSAGSAVDENGRLPQSDVDPGSREVIHGSVAVYAFAVDGRPAEGLTLVLDDAQSAATSADGRAAFDVAPGPHHLKDALGLVDVRVFVAAGSTSDVVIMLQESGVPWIEVDAPEAGVAPTVVKPTDDDAAKSGTVAGVVRAVETNAPVPGVSVGARGVNGDVVTDDAGRFSLTLPVGTHGLSFVHKAHAPQVIEGVVITESSTTTVDVSVVPESAALETFVVKTAHVKGSLASATAVEREAKTITEVLGAEEMSRTGAGDAASALKSVTGVTIVGGRYVYVRGLGDRYSSTLLNGATLPSPEPERRVVPLDLFPTSVLDGVVVHKAYSQTLPGDFGGGTVELKTKGIPEEPVAVFGLRAGGRTGTTFTQGLMGHRGWLDAAGIDDGGRAMPQEVREASDAEPLLERDRFSQRGYTARDLERFGEAMPRTWAVDRALVMPDVGVNAQLGDRWRVGELTVGALAGVNYGNDWQRLRSHREYYTVGGNNELETGHSYDFESLENNVQLGGIAAAGASLGPSHQLTLTSVVGRMTDNETRRYMGNNRDIDGNIEVTRQRFVERTLLAEQVLGHHAFPFLFGLEWDWRYTYALALRNEPDTREVRYDEELSSRTWVLSDRPEGNQRFFSSLVDHGHDVSQTLSLPFTQWNDLQGRVSAGAGLTTKNRAVSSRRFKFMHKGERSGDRDVLTKAPEDVFKPRNIGADGFQFEETTRQTDNYDAQQTVWFAHVGGDIPLWTNLTLAGGLRVEHATQTVRTFALFNPDDEPVEALLQTLDVLPAVALTWGFFDTMQLRTSASVTVSRPDFRELSPATFNDVTGGRQQFGNPDLQRAQIYALDARYEWYPTTGVEFATGVFYKHFVNPIEQVVVVSAQHSLTYANAIAADNVGAELEVRHDFGWMHPRVAGLFVAGNGALIYSNVVLDEESGIQTSNTRALQGQSPFVLNLQAGYDGLESGTRVVVLYNVFGPRISDVGAQGAPDIVEEPFHRLDVNVQQRLPYGFLVGAKFENLIDHAELKTQGERITESTRRGRAVSVSLGYSF